MNQSQTEGFTVSITGPCCVCGAPLGNAEYRAERVVALVGREGAVLLCVEHLTEDGPHGPKYQNALRVAAEAKKKQLESFATEENKRDAEDR